MRKGPQPFIPISIVSPCSWGERARESDGGQIETNRWAGLSAGSVRVLEGYSDYFPINKLQP